MRLWAVIIFSCFAFAQTALAAHEAAFGADLHYHDGELCAVSLHGDRHDHVDVPADPGLSISFRTLFILRPANAVAPQRVTIFARRARAPPHHSSAV